MASVNRKSFCKVTTPFDQECILAGIHREKPLLYVFDEAYQRLVFLVETLSANTALVRLIKGRVETGTDELTVNFSVGGDQFFSKADIVTVLPKHSRKFKISFSSEFYRLQRRSHLRVQIPRHKKVEFQISEESESETPRFLPVVDLSSHGMGLKILADLEDVFKDRKSVSGKLHFDNRHVVEVSCELRSQRKVKNLTDSDLVSGFEFVDLSPQTETIVTARVLDIYRELFSNVSIT